MEQAPVLSKYKISENPQYELASSEYRTGENHILLRFSSNRIASKLPFQIACSYSKLKNLYRGRIGETTI